MCGICGVVTKTNQTLDDIIHRMNLALFHRGPDDEGYYLDGNIGIAMRRLSIIDLSTGHQPMESSSGRYVIVFNGEIYNYKKIRQQYLSEYNFKTQSDTEVVINLFEKYGIKSLDYLKGMFAFSIYDKFEKSIILVRDRLGIKPVYYYDSNGYFLFSSEAKSFYELEGLTFTYDYSCLNDYLAFGYYPQPFSVFKEVKKLAPGHILYWKNGAYKIEKYWGLTKQNSERLSFGESVDRVRELVIDSISDHMVSDVPVGSFLSGGIDSSIVTYGMTLKQERVKTYTIGFNGASNNQDILLSRIISEKFGTDHTESILDIGILNDYNTIIGKMDEPFGITSILPLYLNSLVTKKFVKVALSGDGADELFGGYNRYRQFDKMVHMGNISKKTSLAFEKLSKSIFSLAGSQKLSKGYYHLIKPVADFHRQKSLGLKYLSLLKYNHPDKYCQLFIDENFLDFSELKYLEKLDEYWADINIPDNNSLLLFDLSTSLVDEMLAKVDLASMINSLEVRVPFLDHELVEFITSLPFEYKVGKTNKVILKEAFRDILPSEVLNAPKRGFNLPLDRWIKSSWKQEFLDSFNDSGLDDFGIDRGTLIRQFSDFCNSSMPGGKIYFYIYTLSKWQHNYQSRQNINKSI